jgi:hypothetical protein
MPQVDGAEMDMQAEMLDPRRREAIDIVRQVCDAIAA